MKVVDSFHNHLKNWNEAIADFLQTLKLKLRAYLCLLGYYSCLTGFPCDCSLARFAHLLCNAIINGSWLARDHKRHVIVTYEIVCKCDQVPFLICWVGPGYEANCCFSAMFNAWLSQLSLKMTVNLKCWKVSHALKVIDFRADLKNTVWSYLDTSLQHLLNGH